MHERNIFKNEKPNFERLAEEYKQFAPYVQKGQSGKSFVNFKDPASLRALSCVLLEKYFNISIEVPLDRLIPTIPLRLNYIHWIEDLLSNANKDGGDVFGIDIGCGASCVYSLLGHRINNWKFVVTEIDEESKQYAVANVNRNKMADDITLVKVDNKDAAPLSVVLANTDQQVFHFCMCNPPFYDEVDETPLNRTDHRPPPDSISTANENESVTKGGEVEFVKKMISDSLVLKGKIKWYTSMVGKKSSLKPLKLYLEENGVKKHTMTIFKQGKTTRWGIAWTFTEPVTLYKSNESGKKTKPYFFAPSDTFYLSKDIPILTANMALGGLTEILMKLTDFMTRELDDLSIAHDSPAPVLLQNKTAYEITGSAFSNTWTHQRRKRRQEKFCKIQEKEEDNTDSSVAGASEEFLHQNTGKRKDIDAEVEATNKRLCLNKDVAPNDVKNNDGLSFNTPKTPLFEFSCTIGQKNQFSLDTSEDVILSFLCLRGNRDTYYQLLMYFKNILKATQVQLKH